MKAESGTIGQIARLLGISVETIRFYERRGLIQQPPKPPSGYRVYPGATIDRIRFIKTSQANGFSLADIQILLNLDRLNCAAVAHIASEKLATVRQKIVQLEKVEAALVNIVNQCESAKSSPECPYIFHLLASNHD